MNYFVGDIVRVKRYVEEKEREIIQDADILRIGAEYNFTGGPDYYPALLLVLEVKYFDGVIEVIGADEVVRS